MKYHNPWYFDSIPEWAKSAAEYLWISRVGSTSSAEDLRRTMKEAATAVGHLSSIGFSVMVSFVDQVDEVLPNNGDQNLFYIRVSAKMYSGESEEELKSRVDECMERHPLPPQFEFPK